MVNVRRLILDYEGDYKDKNDYDVHFSIQVIYIVTLNETRIETVSCRWTTYYPSDYHAGKDTQEGWTRANYDCTSEMYYLNVERDRVPPSTNPMQWIPDETYKYMHKGSVKLTEKTVDFDAPHNIPF